MLGDSCPFGEKLQKYWDRRYKLFSLFDSGIQIDEEGLFSVKLEASSLRIGQHLKGEVVVDAFGGVGGSAIGLARAGHKVISVEIDESRLLMAKNNASIY